MAMNVNRAIQLAHGLGQFIGAFLGNTIVSVWQVDVSQAMLLRHGNIRPGSIDTDDCFHPQVSEFLECCVIFRQPSRNHPRMNANGVRKMLDMEPLWLAYGLGSDADFG